MSQSNAAPKGPYKWLYLKEPTARNASPGFLYIRNAAGDNVLQLMKGSRDERESLADLVVAALNGREAPVVIARSEATKQPRGSATTPSAPYAHLSAAGPPG